MNVSEVLDIEFLNGSLPEAVQYALELCADREAEYVVAPDSKLIREFSGDKRVRNAVSNAALILPDCSAVMLASQIMGDPIYRRITMIDFCSAFLARMSEKEMSVFILGSDQDTVELAAENISKRYPGLRLKGTEDGYYTNDNDVVDLINELKPDVVLVSKPSNLQERWMYRYGPSINTGLIIGLGEGLRYYAGLQPRAPKRWRDSGFEWFYWIMKKPRTLLGCLNGLWVFLAALQRRIFGS